MFEENKDRRGVANCGLKIESARVSMGCWCLCSHVHEHPPTVCNNEPLINVEVLRKIGSQAGGGRRNRLDVEVIGTSLLHREIFEVEAIGTKPRQRRIRSRRICAEAVPEEHRRRLHGRQWRRVFHDLMACRIATGPGVQRDTGWVRTITPRPININHRFAMSLSQEPGMSLN